MSYLSSSLDSWITVHQATLQALSADTSIPSSLLSAIRSGKRRITLQAIAKLLPAIERHSTRAEATRLLHAYLRDETPTGWDRDITIEAAGAVLQESSSPPDPLDLIAARWRDRAERDQAFARMWATLDAYMHLPAAEAAAQLGAIEQTRPVLYQGTAPPAADAAPAATRAAPGKGAI